MSPFLGRVRVVLEATILPLSKNASIGVQSRIGVDEQTGINLPKPTDTVLVAVVESATAKSGGNINGSIGSLV